MPLQKITKKEIIRKSIRVFQRKGYYRTTMADLAKETGLTKGAFYHHFSSKEEVMKVSLQTAAHWFDRKVFYLADDASLSPKKKLMAMAVVIYEAFTEGFAGCYFANTVLETAHVEDTFLGEITYFFDQWESALVKVFRGVHPPAKAKGIAQQLIAEIEGSIILMQLHKDASYLKRSLDRGLQRL